MKRVLRFRKKGKLIPRYLGPYKILKKVASRCNTSIDTAPFEAFYGIGCGSPIGWFDVVDVKSLGVHLVKDAQDKGKNIQAKWRIDWLTSLLGVNSVFHLSILKRYHGDRNYIIKWDSTLLDKDLQYEKESVAILDLDVRKLRTKKIKFVQDQWKHCPIEQATWETVKDIRDNYPSCSMIQIENRSKRDLDAENLNLHHEKMYRTYASVLERY
ncbi:hypothetical protein MTR67_023252 [Solanum verrucosum]|uniref:Uncharacterized protein n=1 Tax=Solanum verrucosum TaxID=315347 RepID=A0AAF0QWF3_SOLVR|nr:hypothetical protein MTR67_023252 [Solanum verrucosum]